MREWDKLRYCITKLGRPSKQPWNGNLEKKKFFTGNRKAFPSVRGFRVVEINLFLYKR